MKTSSSILLFGTLVFALLATTLTNALHPVKHDHRFPPDRIKFCGKDTDCVMIKEHGQGGILRIDDLDLTVDTVATIIAKLPTWFGPRPARFVHALDHHVLDKDRPLAQQGVEIMHTLVIYKAIGEDEESVEAGGMFGDDELDKKQRERELFARRSVHEEAALHEEELDPFASDL